MDIEKSETKMNQEIHTNNLISINTIDLLKFNPISRGFLQVVPPGPGLPQGPSIASCEFKEYQFILKFIS